MNIKTETTGIDRESLAYKFGAQGAVLQRYQEALEQIVANRDNKNWRKPEIVACAEYALRSKVSG